LGVACDTRARVMPLKRPSITIGGTKIKAPSVSKLLRSVSSSDNTKAKAKASEPADRDAKEEAPAIIAAADADDEYIEASTRVVTPAPAAAATQPPAAATQSSRRNIQMEEEIRMEAWVEQKQEEKRIRLANEAAVAAAAKSAADAAAAAKAEEVAKSRALLRQQTAAAANGAKLSNTLDSKAVVAQSKLGVVPTMLPGAMPTGLGSGAGVEAGPAIDPVEAIEFFVRMPRNDALTLGVHLVQEYEADFPYVSDVDPSGPAAKVEPRLQVDDVLVDVNGLDARASIAALRASLQAESTWTLRVRREPAGAADFGDASGGAADAATDLSIKSKTIAIMTARDAPPETCGPHEPSFADEGVYTIGSLTAQEAPPEEEEDWLSRLTSGQHSLQRFEHNEAGGYQPRREHNKGEQPSIFACCAARD